MITKGSGFTLIELLVVVAIIGILSATGILAYNGYIKGTKQKSAENAMQQISLAQTEYYSNNGEYHNDGDACTPTGTTSNLIETKLFSGGDVITKEAGYEMCIELDGAIFLVKASNGTKTITLTANGVWTGK